MNKSNALRAQLLGEPHGTATAKLRKALLFTMAQRLGEDKCYRCGDKIETIDEFSIEHKEPWMRAVNPRETFFDLKNIAWSHMLCNSRAAIRPLKKYASAVERRRAYSARYLARDGNRERHNTIRRVGNEDIPRREFKTDRG